MKKTSLLLLLFSFIIVCCGSKNNAPDNLMKFFLEKQFIFKSSIDEISKNKDLLDSFFSIKASDGSFSLTSSFFKNNNRFTPKDFSSTINLLNSSIHEIKCHPNYILFRKFNRTRNFEFSWSEWAIAYNLKSTEDLNTNYSKITYSQTIDDHWKIIQITKSID